MSEAGPNLTSLTTNYVFPTPSDAAMISAPLLLSTCNRWIEIITACKDRKFNLLGSLAATFLGAFLTPSHRRLLNMPGRRNLRLPHGLRWPV